MAKDKYEISLWEDIFVAASGNVPGHYEEEKIAVIGSDEMTSQCRAIEPKLNCNVNGKVTFTFRMFYRYHDELTGQDYENPFLSLLVNERKVKVKWSNQWYDLIIKNIQESSNGKTVVYTCEDANINELARAGFDIIFSDDLSYNSFDEGNQGTAQELVSRTLEGTDWSIDPNNSDVIQQFTEEAVYEVELVSTLSVTNMVTSQSVSIIPTKKVLIFYPQLADFINNNSSGSTTIAPLYLAYDETQVYSRLAKTEMLVQADCCSVASCTCTISGQQLSFRTGNVTFGTVGLNDISTNYRANRLVSSPIKKIEPVTGQSCYIWKALSDGTGAYAGKVHTGDIVYESIGSEFGDALYATDLLVNGSAFTNTDGWDFSSSYPLSLKIYPTELGQGESTGRNVYIFMEATYGASRYFYNDAIRGNSQYFKNGCQQGEVYRLRMKIKRFSSGNFIYCVPSDANIYPIVQQWTNNSGTTEKQPRDGGITYFSITSTQPTSEGNGWLYFDMTCTNSFTGSDIYKDNIGLFFRQTPTTIDRYIEEVQFFKVVRDSSNNVILPGDFDKTGIVKTSYNYFTVKNGEVNYLYKGTEDWNKSGVNLQQMYNEGYAKVRAINIKQSNRFNILQTIAETFECWIRFRVEHDESGKITYVNGVPQKFVTIRREMGEERGIGFVYGIDLQSIQRTIESNQIVTKTIVLENNNEFGENGTCRISRSTFNYPLLDYIYNFDYYVNHNLMSGDELNNDLYGKTNNLSDQNTVAFYACMRKWNSEYIDYADKIAHYEIALNKEEGLLTVYNTGIEAAEAEIKTHKQSVCNLAGTANDGNVKAYDTPQTQSFIQQYVNIDQTLKAHVAAIEAQTKLKTTYAGYVSKLESSIASYKASIAAAQAEIDNRKQWIKNKTNLFNKKYARFISEGSWIDQKYYDDNLYYLDANSVAYTSSRPKVSYNIAVMRLTGIDEFKIKDFGLGDISYIEDTEFFGYTYINNVKTPYREKVVITEVTYNFDEPQKDSFKVQNYRTQFEDLFQRITAQTQSLQYTVGAYNKVSDIINSNGTIKGETLISSVAANGNALNRSSLNNLVVTDERGITVTNTQNASQAVRVTSGGLFITTNGGDTWNNAIRGDGIGTQFLSSGAINTKKIQIIAGGDEDDEAAVAFKWDLDGITAYDSFSTMSSGVAYDQNKYVRFYNEGIKIQTKNGNTPYEKLKLGRLNENNEYGLRINACTSSGSVYTTLEAKDNGNLFVRGNIYADSLTLGDNVTVAAADVSGLAAVATTGAYSSLSGKPDLTVYVAKDGTIGSTPSAGSGTGFLVSSAGLLSAKNAVIWGTLYSSVGQIGGLTLANNSLYNGLTSYADTAHDGIWVGTDGIALGKNKFKVSKTGSVTASDITATGGKIGKFNITSTYLDTGIGTTNAGFGGNQAFWAGNSSSDSAPFRVAYNGTLVATSGKIGGWEITDPWIRSVTPVSSGVSTTVYETYMLASKGTNNSNGAFGVRHRSWNGSSYGDWVSDFYVTHGGTLYATKGTIGNCSIDANGKLIVPVAQVSGNFSADRITSGTLDANKVTVSNLSANSITGGTINASTVTITNINASNITSGTISADRINMAGITISGSQISDNVNSKVTSIGAGVITSGTIAADRISADTINAKIAAISGLVTINHGLNVYGGNIALVGDGSISATNISCTNLTIGGVSLAAYLASVISKQIYMTNTGTGALYGTSGTNREPWGHARA